MHAVAAGLRLFGKVDRVPGKYHVATRCWHFCYLPLIPLGTYLVLHERTTGMTNEFEGVRIPFSFKSYLVAWTRSLLVFPLVMMCVVTILAFTPGPPEGPRKAPFVVVSILLGFALLLFGPYWLPGIGRATRSRAEQLAAYAAGAEPDSLIQTTRAMG